MRVIKTKEEFIAKMKKAIESRNTLIKFYNENYLPTLKKFDGKVYNIRFIKALREQAEKISDLMYVKEYSHVDKYIEVTLRNDRYNYNDYESLWMRYRLVDGRLSYDETVNDQMGKDWIDNFIKYNGKYQMAIDNYDTYMKITEEMEKSINEYNKLPYTFRGNVDRNYFYIY